MGRKIRGRKHRGTRDPEKQNRQRFNSIKNKINLPPSNPDIQETPHSVNQIAKFKEDLKVQHQGIIKQKPKHKRLPYTQQTGESNKQFLYRVKRACDVVIQENAFENKYGVNIKRNPQTGEVEGLVKKPKDEIDQLMKKMRKKKVGKAKQKLKSEEPVLTKSQKRRKKLKEKKQKKELMNSTVEYNANTVKFGEVVHAPPTLSIPKNATKAMPVSRPGQKDLLLSSLLQKKQSTSTLTKDKLHKVANKVIDKTAKRKELPNALRRKLEQQQSEIIQAYRLLKKQKRVPVH